MAEDGKLTDPQKGIRRRMQEKCLSKYVDALNKGIRKRRINTERLKGLSLQGVMISLDYGLLFWGTHRVEW